MCDFPCSIFYTYPNKKKFSLEQVVVPIEVTRPLKISKFNVRFSVSKMDLRTCYLIKKYTDFVEGVRVSIGKLSANTMKHRH